MATGDGELTIFSFSSLSPKQQSLHVCSNLLSLNCFSSSHELHKRLFV